MSKTVVAGDRLPREGGALLRLVMREPGALDDLRTYAGLVSSEPRTIDRLRQHLARPRLTVAQVLAHDAALGGVARAFGFDCRGA